MTFLSACHAGGRGSSPSLPLAWGLIDNRPFLRCLHGRGLCRGRLGCYDEATAVFETLLWLNPTDNQGARDLVELTRHRMPWLPSDV